MRITGKRLIECLPFIVVSTLITGMCLSCGNNNTTDFTVEMRRSDDLDDVLYLGVNLPTPGHERDITFVINDVVYHSTDVLTVQNPNLVFEDVDCDDFQSITLKLPCDRYDDTVLCVTTLGGDELFYCVAGTDFNKLLEYLGEN